MPECHENYDKNFTDLKIRTKLKMLRLIHFRFKFILVLPEFGLLRENIMNIMNVIMLLFLSHDGSYNLCQNMRQ